MGERNDGSFGFEKLDDYQAAVQFIPLAGQVIVDLPPGYHPYADQLRRAALSIAVNIAEGVGRTNPTASHRRNAHEDVPLIVHVHVHVHVHGNWDMHPSYSFANPLDA